MSVEDDVSDSGLSAAKTPKSDMVAVVTGVAREAVRAGDANLMGAP